MSDELTVAEAEGIATVTISRPLRRNALSRRLLAEAAGALGAMEGTGLRAVVLEGAAGCFSSGADLSELDGSPADLSMDDAVGALGAAVRALSIPVLAAIEGPCVGAAVEVAFACDLRIASSSAFIEVPAVRLGILYNPAAVARLSTLLGTQTLTRLLLFGERLDAPTMDHLGLVAGPVVPEGQARSRALELAASLPSGPWPAAAATKRLLSSLAGAGPAIPEAFGPLRRRLAASPQRVAALEAARHRRGRPTSGE